jgi:hypothetical protein
MPMDLDEQDLYPPDAEDLTPAAREHRKRVAVGTALVVWGAGLLVERALGVDLETFWLGLGLAAVAGWTQVRQYNWFVAGSIMTGVGVGSLLSAPFDNGFGAAVANLGIGAGFAAIYVRYPRRSSWAIAVAGVFALIAVAAFGIGLIGLVPAVLGRFLLPLLLIGGGVLLLLRHSLPPKTVKAGLAALAVSFVVVGAASVPDIDDRPISIDVGGGPIGTAVTALPRIDDQKLVIRTGSGDVQLVAVGPGGGRIEARGAGLRPGSFRDFVDVDDDEVVIDRDTGGPFGAGGSTDYVVHLPPGVELDIETQSGDITGTLAGAEGSLRTQSGRVRVEIVNGGAESTSDDGPYEFESQSGAIRIDSRLLLDLDVDTDSGEITIDGRRIDDDDFESKERGGVEVEVSTQSGAVRIDRPGSLLEAPTATSSPVPPGGD